MQCLLSMVSELCLGCPLCVVALRRRSAPSLWPLRLFGPSLFLLFFHFFED